MLAADRSGVVMLRFAAGSSLCLILHACSNDRLGPPGPPPPPPPPALTVATVTTNTIAPWQLAVLDSVLYWVDASETPFNKLSLASGATRVGLFRPLPAPEGEISDGNYVYWISGANLYRTTLDGSTTTLLDHGTGPAGAALTMDADYIYWANSVPSSSCRPPCKFAIRRASKTGGAATQIAPSTEFISAVPALALAGGYLFWEEESGATLDSSGNTGSKIMKVSLANGTITTVVNGLLNGLIQPPSPGYIPASWYPRGGIVADTDFVYFSDADFFQRYRVMAVPVSGGAINILLADTTHVASDFVRGMTDDSTTLYWVDENDVRSMPKSGGPVTDLAAARLHKPGSVTRVGSNLYWIENHCCLTHGKSSIYTIPTAGGTPVVVHDSVVTPLRIASDATHLFWIEGGPYGETEGYAGLRASALDGTTVVTVVEAAGAGRFATDGNAMYFANRWTIKSVSTTGGTSRRLAIGDFYVKDVATDGQRVYWLEDPDAIIRSVSVNGGPVTTLSVTGGPANRLRVDGTYVYWLTHNDVIHRVPKVGGATVTLVGPISGNATDFAIDATNIYISGWDSGIISRVPIGGGTPTTIASPGPDQTRRIAADGGKVYWIDQRNIASVTADGRTTPIHGGILSDPFSENGLAFDNQSLFWTENAMNAIRKATPK